MNIFEKIFRSSEGRIREYRKIADVIEALEPQFQAMTDEELKAKTLEYKKRYQEGETLDELLPEVFAQVREASVRTLHMRHYYVQLIGGIVLHKGNIAEMRTGEGKTLVATLPICLNAIAGKGAHLVTVNDYLAKRDAEWMGKIYRFLGFSVGMNLKDMEPEEKQAAYACDITYGTNNEFGFDYLRDNMVNERERMVQRDLFYAIVDEVDSILIDEARTPLIISGPGDKSTDMYRLADRFVRTLREEEDYTADEKAHTANLTEDGIKKAEKAFSVTNLSDTANTEINHHINQALKAHRLMHLDKDYVVQDDQVIIVDEFTGRLMTGRRYSEGLHQAIEAKEGVKVKRESKTLATITFQNYFRMYEKLSGMTGTAKTEEDEFNGIYNLEVIEIPTNMDMIREDCNDVIYTTVMGKFKAVVDEIEVVHKTGQPILVGTVSVEKSEVLSDMLSKRGVKHEVLNAKHHKKEAEIVAQAGKYKAVTIATNMAGRGTDIILGGNPDMMARLTLRQDRIEEEQIEEAVGYADTKDENILALRKRYKELYEKYKAECDTEHEKVVSLGGLHIIGTERHESRRIDNQLRGRSGRQGDPGSTRFYISLQDDLMRLFGGEKIKNLMGSLNPDDNVPLEFGFLSKQIETAQKRIEGHNFEIRKHVLNYDDVMNKQREIIYRERRKVLTGEDVHQNIVDMLDTVIDDSVSLYCPGGVYPEEWDLKGLTEHLSHIFLPPAVVLFEDDEKPTLTQEDVKQKLTDIAYQIYELKEKQITEAGHNMRDIERIVLLRVVDDKWMDHIDAMDQLRQGIGLRAYGQRDPIVAYRLEGFEMFDAMTKSIQNDTVAFLYHVNVERTPEKRREPMQMQASHGDSAEKRQAKKTGPKVGRNDPCPCGSGKKYKNCCGQNE
jgi:preprotein translocase subunit SecA